MTVEDLAEPSRTGTLRSDNEDRTVGSSHVRMARRKLMSTPTRVGTKPRDKVVATFSTANEVSCSQIELCRTGDITVEGHAQMSLWAGTKQGVQHLHVVLHGRPAPVPWQDVDDLACVFRFFVSSRVMIQATLAGL
jgi:hypothetical protein